MEFSAGILDTAQAIAISAHLHYCPRCRSKVEDMNTIGAALFSMAEQPTSAEAMDIEGQTHKTLSFDALMKTIEHNDKVSTEAANDTLTLPVQYSGYPKVVQKMLAQQKLSWKRITSGLKAANLVSGQHKYGVYLQRIEAGCQVPEHDHRGDEITVVLRGSISDEDGVYHTGDFIFKAEGDVHSPRASNNEECLCLSIQQAPVKLTGVWGRFINPLLRINAI